MKSMVPLTKRMVHLQRLKRCKALMFAPSMGTVVVGRGGGAGGGPCPGPPPRLSENNE